MHTATMPERCHSQPVTAPEPDGPIARPARPRPVWIDVQTDHGTWTRTKGFALAWTPELVRVQVLWPKEYYSAATEFWVSAARVVARTIEPQWLGR